MKKDERARYNAMKHDLQVGQLQSQEFLAETPAVAPEPEAAMAPLPTRTTGRFAGMRIALLTGGAASDLADVVAALEAEGAAVEQVADARTEMRDALMTPAFARAIADLLDDAAIL
jgi:hypothetical protein